ncbi:hypothetical protein EHE19_005935 [Ruminiclostridium herbifermentans]|uniref:Uncharacterized protein n=1 Tax=Ruminiclostridium herbifermentans TaxID=2488810 RepID=A0A4V6ENK0_9FIRM|nr:hypothetical protein [Ruminiclostridium herbifermentans]QNU67981.1 hypothetical protein EHE19_005935 [Ruminiclostridium herbifermentans]
MRLKSVVKYNLYDIRYGVMVYYIVIAALMGLLIFMRQTGLVRIGTSGFVSGAEASAIFLFVCGLNSFKQIYLYLSTNGITRKTQFYGFLISSVIISAGMAFIDTASTNIINIFMNYRPMFYQLFNQFTVESSQFLITIMSFLWNATVNLLAFVIGYLITTLYYRMSKILKIIVSVGVPSFFIIGFPMLASYLYKIGYINEFTAAIKFLIDGNGNPIVNVIIIVLEIAIVAGLSYLLVRKAPVKE